MSDSASFDFEPRARGRAIDGIPWLARIRDKARARMQSYLQRQGVNPQ